MADQIRDRKKRRKIRYFYLDTGDGLRLHKVLHVNRGGDIVTAWSYSEHKRKAYVWSDVQKMMQNAYTITEVAEMIGRHRMRVDSYIREGHIRKPQRIYEIFTGTPGKYLFSEDDVLDLHEYLTTVHRGRPRNDGLITTNRVPNRDEMRALVHQGTVLYTTDKDGNFVPIWKEQIW